MFSIAENLNTVKAFHHGSRMKIIRSERKDVGEEIVVILAFLTLAGKTHFL